MYFSYSPLIKLQNFGRFGDFSYGMYIYAFPLQQLVVMYLGVLSLWVNFALVFFVTLLFAVMSWKFVENPSLKLKGKGDAYIVMIEQKLIAVCRKLVFRFFKR